MNELQYRELKYRGSSISAICSFINRICFFNISSLISTIGQLYIVGDNIILRENTGKLLIAKLLEIIPTGGIPTYEEFPSVKVQWYYHPSDLDLPSLGIHDQDYVHLGDNELFYSDHTDIVYIGSIIGK